MTLHAGVGRVSVLAPPLLIAAVTNEACRLITAIALRRPAPHLLLEFGLAQFRRRCDSQDVDTSEALDESLSTRMDRVHIVIALGSRIQRVEQSKIFIFVGS